MKNFSLFLAFSLLCARGINAMEGNWRQGSNVDNQCVPLEVNASKQKLSKPSRENYKQATIMLAAGNGWQDIVEEWIKQEPKAFVFTDKYRQTALYWASLKGYDEIFTLLTKDKQSNLNVRNTKGWTPLMIAAYNGHENIVTKLAQFGAYLHLQDNNGRSAFQLACANGRLNCAKRIQVQLLNAFDVNEQDKSGSTALHWSAFNGHTDTIKYLLDDCKADVTVANNDGIKPVHRAVQKGHFELAKLLVGKNTINERTSNELENTLLHYVAQSEYPDAPAFAAYLIENLGANVNLANADGDTPGHLVKTAAMAQTLFFHRADFRVKNNDGETARNALKLITEAQKNKK